jgi:plasmid stability protein
MVQKTPNGKQDQITVRLPDGMRAKIKLRAQENMRSMHSEVVAALENSVLPALTIRLRILFDQIKGAGNEIEATPAQVAERAGEVDLERLENSLAGWGDGLTFLETNAIAGLWGVRPDWLKHGTGAIYPVRRTCGFDTFAADQFLHSAAEKLLVLRSDSIDGPVLIVIQHGNGSFEIIDPGLNLNVDPDPRRLEPEAEFANACVYLLKARAAKIEGYLLHDSIYWNLRLGNLYPGFVIKRHRPSVWVTEWWDEQQFSQIRPRDYWPGYREYCGEIHSFIESTLWLRDERESILAGTWKGARSSVSAMGSQ